MFTLLSMRLKIHILVFFNYLISSHPYTHSQDQLLRMRKERENSHSGNVAFEGASWQTHTPSQAWEFLSAVLVESIEWYFISIFLVQLLSHHIILTYYTVSVLSFLICFLINCLVKTATTTENIT